MEKFLFLGLGGVAGTVMRYALAGLVYQWTGMNFPYGTLVVNLTGCFLVGFLDIWLEQKFGANMLMRLMLITGFCGAFTTFSAFMLEFYDLIRSGQLLPAALYMGGSLLLGLVMFRLGMIFAVRLWG